MTIQAQLPGGLTLEFPDGTPDAIVQGAVKQQLSQQPDSASQTPESKLGLTPAPPEETPPKETGTAPEAVGDTVVSPDDVARVNAPPANPPITSLTDLRDRIQQGDISTLKTLAPGPDAGPIERGARYAAMVGEHGLASLAQMPVNALMGLEQGPSGAVTINPATNTLGLTPEAMTATQMLTPGVGYGGRDVRFSGADAFKREAPSTLEQAGVMKPAPVTLEELNAAINRVPQNQMMPGEAPPPSGPAPAQPQPQGTATATPQTDTTGLAAGVGGMGSAISESLRDHLWGQLQKGDLTEAGAPSTILQAAKAQVDSGAIKTRADFDQFYQNYGDQLRAQRQGQQPQPASQPAATAPPQPAPAAAAGAQVTPAAELGMTPAEEAAYRSTAEGNKLLEPQEPGIRDEKQYLTGERINEAEASQDVETARRLKSLRQQTPALDAQMTADENFNNNLRYNAINNAIPGRVQIQAAEAARTQAMQTAEPQVFSGPNVTDANTQPIVQDIQDILNDPKNRQNTQLRQYVRPLIDRLVNPDGTPKITDPRELWGWRQDVQHLTSKAAQIGDPNLSRVSGILGKVLDTTDNQIEAAAPGYKAQLRDEYRTRSREIDAMTALNDERFKLFDSQNVPNYNAVQGLMRRITDARQEADPYEPFTHVQQDTLDKLWDIRDTMRRSRAADRLAAPKGSPTAQNFGDAMRAAGKMAMQGAAPAIGATIGSAIIPIPGVGPALGLTAGAALNHLLSERAMAQRLAEGRGLLQPNQLGPSP